MDATGETTFDFDNEATRALTRLGQALDSLYGDPPLSAVTLRDRALGAIRQLDLALSSISSWCAYATNNLAQANANPKQRDAFGSIALGHINALADDLLQLRLLRNHAGACAKQCTDNNGLYVDDMVRAHMMQVTMRYETVMFNVETLRDSLIAKSPKPSAS